MPLLLSDCHSRAIVVDLKLSASVTVDTSMLPSRHGEPHDTLDLELRPSENQRCTGQPDSGSQRSRQRVTPADLT